MYEFSDATPYWKSEDNPAGSGNSETPTDPPAEETQSVEIAGEKYTEAELSEILRTKDNWEKHYQGKYQENAARARDLDAKERELSEMRAQLERARSVPKADPSNPYDGMSEYVPGLGDFAREVKGTLSELKQAQEKRDKESAKFFEATQREEEWEKVESHLQSNRPFMKEDKKRAIVRQAMEEKGLEPTVENADFTYRSLYGIDIGRVTTEQRLGRAATIPSPQGVGSMGGLPGSTVEDVPVSQKPISEQSFEERIDMARKDPRMPKLSDFED
jgi:hypothetical protein